MEKATYRDNLELLTRLYPDKAVLTLNEAAALLGRTPYTVQNDGTFPLTKIGGRYVVSIANFARWLAV